MTLCIRLTITVSLLIAAGIAAESPRNIVFILTDDQRFDAIGAVEPYFETPHLNALIHNGVLFENAFVTNSLCSPSRASILSGQWAHRHGVLDNETPLDPATPTFPAALQNAGYTTAFIGKWHMGGNSDDPQPGFDHWVSFRGQGVYYNPNFNVNGERLRHDGYTTDLLTGYALDFIDDAADEPFMLYLSHKAVHAMFEPAARHEGSYNERAYPYPDSMADTEANYEGKPEWVREQRNTWHGVDGLYNNSIDLDEFTQNYAETLKAVDDSVGRVVAALRQKGLLDSTLFVFTSDNGFQFGEHGLIDKRTMYEDSIRVPLIVHCPELLEGGQRRDQMVINTDFFPTFLEMAGLPIPDSVQGQSFWPALTQNAPGREAFAYTYFWENMFPQTPTVFGLRTDRYKLMTFHGIFDRWELYDLQNDPDEMHNLIGPFNTTTEAGNIEFRVGAATTEPFVNEFASEEEAKRVRDLFRSLHKTLQTELDRIGVTTVPRWDTAPN